MIASLSSIQRRNVKQLLRIPVNDKPFGRRHFKNAVFPIFSVPHRSILARNVGCLPNFADIFGGFGKVVACDYFYLRQAAVVTYASPKAAQAARRSLQNSKISLIASRRCLEVGFCRQNANGAALGVATELHLPSAQPGKPVLVALREDEIDE